MPVNLRSLAKEYANGTLGFQAYRKARDELIESILAGNTIVTAHNFQPPLKLQRAEVTPDFTDSQTGIAIAPAPRSSDAASTPAMDAVERQDNGTPARRGLLFGFAAIIILLVIAVAIYPFTQQKNSAPVAANPATSPGAVAHPDMQYSGGLSGGVTLIKQFLKQTDWTDESLRLFISAWQGLSAEERDAGLSSSAKTELANAIYRKLQEERIMQGLGDGQTSMDKQATLVAFAQQIGINDPRIVVKGIP